MRALIADDDPVTAALVAGSVRRWHLEPIVAYDGKAAWERLCEPDPPLLAILDWMMPEIDGLELCRRLRSRESTTHTYVILLTGRDSSPDRVTGLEAGADDYLVKPFDIHELRARVNIGVRTVSLQQQLSSKIAALEETIANVKQLKGLLPICSYCKRIRSDQDYWQQLEGYISDHSDAQFSHGVCPGCYDKVLASFTEPK
jgi:DNA-binding response OmpR family regulator